jgi:hypothetical protein
MPPPYTGVDVTGYHVYRDGGTDPIATLNDYSYVDAGPAGTAHSYTVAAIAAAGEGDRSGEVSATVPANDATAGSVNGMAVDGSNADYAAAGGTPSPWSPGSVRINGSVWQATVSLASGQAWAPGTVHGSLSMTSCGASGDFVLQEARVHADGTPVALALTADLPCGHVELRYAAHTGFVGLDTPESLGSPATKPGTTAAAQAVTVTNYGTLPVTFGTAVVTGKWTTGTDTCSGATLAGGTSCAVQVAFAPTSLGYQHGSVTIPDDTARGHRFTTLDGDARDVPSAVRDVHAVALVGRRLLTWTPPEAAYPGLYEYEVQRATAAGGPFRTVAYSYSYSDTSAVDEEPVPPGQRLYYRVRARNGVGLGAAGLTVTVVPPAREVVYTADTGSGVYHLYAQVVGGSTPVRLTDVPNDEEDPAISPNQTRLAYTKEVDPGRLRVYHMDAFGRGGSNFASDVDGQPWTYRNPSWSPDGSTLAYACRPLSQDWFDLCIRKSGSATKIVPAVLPSGGTWVNDNELLVVSATSPPEVQIVARDGSYRRTIAGTSNARHAALSPDGSRFAWTRYDGTDTSPGTGSTNRYSLHVSPLSGGSGVTITSTGYSNDPSWAPDGKTVYYTHAARTAEGLLADRDVYYAPATGGTPVRITNTPDIDEDNVTVHDAVAQPVAPYVPRQLADFSGDGRAELAVWRPGTGQWRIRGLTTVTWGRLGDVPVPADYNGDGKADRAVFRPSDGTWRVYGHSAVTYGRAGDVPVPADYNGDGKAEFALFRPSTGRWYVYGHAGFVFGRAGDVPMPVDRTGDHRADLVLYRASTPSWWRYPDYGSRTQYGGIPAAADYFGTGKAQLANLHGNDWVVDGRVIATVPPSPHDLVVYGNVNGDRRVEPGVFNPTLGLWRVLNQDNVVWGVPGDIPV